MLLHALKNLFGSRTLENTEFERESSFTAIVEMRRLGDPRSAIKALHIYLKRNPHDAGAFNELGCCCYDIGDDAAAGAAFERAYVLDDTLVPVLLNRSKFLIEARRIDEAMPLMARATASAPSSHDVASVYATLAFQCGQTSEAAAAALRAWLGSFDSLRRGNSHLFSLSNAAESDQVIAAEHRFWAETLKPSLFQKLPAIEASLRLPPKSGRIRVGYWSPDFRGHSVAFFVRSFLKHHDRSKFEIVGYFDFPHADEVTQELAAACDHFCRVFELPDAKLKALFLSHELDVLVELAGHTTANRLLMLQDRLAKVQVTGLGYPPTTGMQTIDYKFVDRHIVTKNDHAAYAEQPMIVGDSFWCFDPGSTPAINPEPPCVRNGFVQFACIGNIAKISDRALLSWRAVLEGVPKSHLRLRSISFFDPAVMRIFEARLSALGFDMTRLEMLQPTAVEELFSSYNDIDIVLDTFPFNGGTTTCFATYMGVPVVTIAGESLISRMGMSVLSNLGLVDWIASDTESYVNIAVQNASDIAALRAFRQSARALYRSSSLGDGVRFATDVEQQYLLALDNAARADGSLHSAARTGIPALPVSELIRRARGTMSAGNFDAGHRILKHCLSEYPNSAEAHVMSTQKLTQEADFAAAFDYLKAERPHIDSAGQFFLLNNLIKIGWLAGRDEQIADLLESAKLNCDDTDTQRSELRLLESTFKVTNQKEPWAPDIDVQPNAFAVTRVAVIFVADDAQVFALFCNDVTVRCDVPDGVTIDFLRGSEDGRRDFYLDQFQQNDYDVILIVQKGVKLVRTDFFREVLISLTDYDLLSSGGAKRWTQFEWRLDARQEKCVSHIAQHGERSDFFELVLLGNASATVIGEMAVLDGNFLAIKTSALVGLPLEALFDPVIKLAGVLPEEHFSFAAHKMGLKLAAHLNLGLVVDQHVGVSIERLSEVRCHISEQLGFDPFDAPIGDRHHLSVPLASAVAGVAVLHEFLSQASITGGSSGPVLHSSNFLGPT